MSTHNLRFGAQITKSDFNGSMYLELSRVLASLALPFGNLYKTLPGSLLSNMSITLTKKKKIFKFLHRAGWFQTFFNPSPAEPGYILPLQTV